MSVGKKSTAVLSICVTWFFYLFTYIARVEPSVLVNNLMSEFSMNSSTIGFVISIMYISYVVMQFPYGIIVDKLGVRTVVSFSALLCAIGTFVFGAAESVFHLQLGRFLIGLASASAFLCCGKIAGEYFSKKIYSMLMGIAMLMGCTGGIFGTAPTAYLVSYIGWRNTTFVISAVSALIAVLAFCIMKKNPKQKKEDSKSEGNILTGLRIMATNPQTWIIGFYGAVTYLPLSAMAELWGVPFIEMRYGISTEAASISSIFIFIGYGLGGIVSAYVAELINSYKKTIIISTICLVLTFSVALYNDDISYTLYLILMCFGGVFAGTSTLCFALAFNVVPKQYAGTSTGFMNGLIMSSGLLFQPLLGEFLDFFRNGMVTSSGQPLYNLGMYRSAFQILIVVMILATISTFFIRDVKKEE
ncbi:MAG: MFS transporter [Holosporales bacterium]|jgi:sugar phosphate permease|nr:MFS transporter [Holosporales bacterium]